MAYLLLHSTDAEVAMAMMSAAGSGGGSIDGGDACSTLGPDIAEAAAAADTIDQVDGNSAPTNAK